MPIYQYECIKCSLIFEEMHTMDERRNAVCPICGGKAEKVFTPIWYKIADNWHTSSNVASDGEGFTSKTMSKDEYAYLRQEIRGE